MTAGGSAAILWQHINKTGPFVLVLSYFALNVQTRPQWKLLASGCLWFSCGYYRNGFTFPFEVQGLLRAMSRQSSYVAILLGAVHTEDFSARIPHENPHGN